MKKEAEFDELCFEEGYEQGWDEALSLLIERMQDRGMAQALEELAEMKRRRNA